MQNVSPILRRPRFIVGFGLVLVLSVAVFVLAGCSKDAAENVTGKVTVRMWTFPMLPELRDQEIYDELLRRFKAEHPEIKVEIETLPWVGRTQKMITAIAGNRAPDCVYLNLDLVAQMVSRDALLPIDQYLSEEIRQDYGPELLDSITVDKHRYIFPMLRTVYAALYNRDLLKQAGWDPDSPPTNWDQLADLAARATRDIDGDGRADQHGFGIILGGDTLNGSLWPLLWQAGGQVFSDDGTRAAFNSPAGVEALSFITENFKKGYIPHSFLSVSGGGEFGRGKLAYWFGAGSVELQGLRRDIPDLPLDVAPILEKDKRIGYSSVAGYAVFKTSKHPKETAIWLNFMTRPDNMKYFCKSTNYFPCKKSVGPIYTDDPLMSKLEAELPFTRPDVNHEYARQVPQILIPEMQQALFGQKTPEQALKDAESAVNAMLERGR